MTLLGNQLDKLMRALNYDQTNGILVGNAVSRIISEIILCSVDEQISKKDLFSKFIEALQADETIY